MIDRSKRAYQTGLVLAYVLFLPSLWMCFAGMAAFPLGAHASLIELPVAVLAFGMPVITLGSVAMAINLRGKGRLTASTWVAWTPMLAAGLLALLVLLPVIVVLLATR